MITHHRKHLVVYPTKTPQMLSCLYFVGKNSWLIAVFYIKTPISQLTSICDILTLLIGGWLLYMYRMQHLSVVFACCQLHLSVVLFVHDAMETLERCTMNVPVARHEVQWLIVAYCFNFASIDARRWYTMCKEYHIYIVNFLICCWCLLVLLLLLSVCIWKRKMLEDDR